MLPDEGPDGADVRPKESLIEIMTYLYAAGEYQQSVLERLAAYLPDTDRLAVSESLLESRDCLLRACKLFRIKPKQLLEPDDENC